MLRYDDIRLVGLVGKAGSGKDTVAECVSGDGWERVAFADALKDLCVRYLGLSHDDVHTQMGKAAFNAVWGMTNREILQRVGTDAMRNGFRDDVWVKVLEIKVRRLLDGGRRVVVTDCRFDNEAAMVERLGGMVAVVERPGLETLLGEGEARHASENGVSDRYRYAVIMNDTGIRDLRQRFASVVEGFGRRHAQLAGVLPDCPLDGGEGESLLLSLRRLVGAEVSYACPRGDGAHCEWHALAGGLQAGLECVRGGSLVFHVFDPKGEGNVELTGDLSDDGFLRGVSSWLEEHRR